MEFRDVLARRRMHRAFETTPISREVVKRIVGVIRRAPSGGFSQGGSIVVVTDDERRAAIAPAFGDGHYSQGGRNFLADGPVHLATPTRSGSSTSCSTCPKTSSRSGWQSWEGRVGDPPAGSRLASRRRPLDDLVQWQRW